jgi:hypothetical protein
MNKKMEEITYKGEQGIFLTHQEKNKLLTLVNKQSKLAKEAIQTAKYYKRTTQ